MQDWFFPKNCLNCHAEGVWLCESCRDSLFFIGDGFCPFCGGLTELFSVCKKCKSATQIEKVFSIVKYSDPLAQKIIKNFKYRYIKDIAADLEPLMRKFLLKYKNLLDIKENTVLIPVPLHWYRECSRGFNQAEEFAKIIGKILDIPVVNSLVMKKKRTRNQADVGKADRYSNLTNSFKVNSNSPKNIILVDDVFTTGSTVRELALSLKENGAENIKVFTLARG